MLRLVMYLPALLCLRKGGSVGGLAIEDFEGAAMADSDLEEVPHFSPGSRDLGLIQVEGLINRIEGRTARSAGAKGNK